VKALLVGVALAGCTDEVATFESCGDSIHDIDLPAEFEIAGVTSRAPQALFSLEP
jgi:hypothetical protein